jgi:hypothetical protein
VILLLACATPEGKPAPEAPSVTVSPASLDFGDLALGCSTSGTLTLTNTSESEQIVSTVEGTSETLTLDSDVPPPWEIAPGASLDVTVAWEPSLEESLDTALTFTGETSTVVPVTGSASIEEQGTDTFTAPDPVAVTSLLAFHYYVASDQRLLDALPTWLATLRGTGGPFRAAFLVTEDGIPAGSIPMIDDSMSDEEALAAAAAQLAPASGDNDYLMQTLSNGLAENADWLFADGWEDARLALVGGNPDLDQSTGNSTLYLKDFWSYKDPSLLTVSHIGGDYPRGCGSFATLSPMFYEAAEATGGVYLSICEPDWTDHARQLAWNAAGPSPYTLQGSPAPATIAVRIDGVATDAWQYDASGPAIRLDAHPGTGATVEVDYAWASCD